MSFAQELKEFVSGFKSGYDMIKMPSKAERDAAGAEKAFAAGRDGSGNRSPYLAPKQPAAKEEPEFGTTDNAEKAKLADGSSVPLPPSRVADLPAETGGNASLPNTGAGYKIPGERSGRLKIPGSDVQAPDQFRSLFAEKEKQYGLPDGYLARTARIESRFNPNAKNPNSSAGGLFQFINSTAKQYGLSNRFDPEAATDAAARLARDNAQILRKSLGRDPTGAELYLAHQQGGGGASKILKNPNVPLSDLVGREAARLNMGGNMSAGEFAKMFENKFEGKFVGRRGGASGQFRPSAMQEEVTPEGNGGQGIRARANRARAAREEAIPMASPEEQRPEEAEAIPGGFTGEFETDPDYLDPDEPLRYAQGGVVEPEAAIPEAVPESAQRYNDEDVRYDPRRFVDRGSVGDAVDAGMQFIQKQFGFNDNPQGAIEGVPNPRRQQSIQAFANNAGAMRPEEVREVENTVDPRRELSGDERIIAGYNAVYYYWMNKGEPEKAQRAVAGMLMHAKRTIATAGNLAEAALEKGDVKGAAQAVATAYDTLPDGKKLQVVSADKKGVRFKLLDETGAVTEQGRASLDQLMETVTGMQNGTQWFENLGMIKSARGPDKTAIRNEKRTGAIADFENSRSPEDENEFRSTLTEDQLEKFLKLDPQDQARYRREFFQRREAERKQGNITTNRQDRLQRWEQTDAARAVKEAVRKGEWETRRNDLMSARARQEALRLKDLDDRNARFDQSQEARRKRDLERDQMLMEREHRAREERRVRDSAPKTLGERQDAAIDEAIPGASQQAIADNEETNEQGLVIEGPSLGQQQALSRVQAGAAGDKRANDRNVGKFSPGGVEAAEGAITSTLAEAQKRNPAMRAPPQSVIRTMATSAEKIARVNEMMPDDAANLVLSLANPANMLRVDANGRVKVGGRMLLIPSDVLQQIEAVRKMARGPTSPVGNAPSAPPPPGGPAIAPGGNVTSAPRPGAVNSDPRAAARSIIERQRGTGAPQPLPSGRGLSIELDDNYPY